VIWDNEVEELIKAWYDSGMAEADVNSGFQEDMTEDRIPSAGCIIPEKGFHEEVIFERG